MRIGIIRGGDVGTTLAKGLKRHEHSVTLGSRSPEKLQAFSSSEGITVTSVEEAASEHADLLILAVRGSAALAALGLIGSERLRGKIVIDATNPLADAAPEQGVLRLFTQQNQSLMEAIQRKHPETRFVKAFNSVGAASMIDPSFDALRPTMFICGNDLEAKQKVQRLLESVGWEVADMGGAVAARAIEPLSFSGVFLGSPTTSGPTLSSCCDGEKVCKCCRIRL